MVHFQKKMHTTFFMSMLFITAVTSSCSCRTTTSHLQKAISKIKEDLQKKEATIADLTSKNSKLLESESRKEADAKDTKIAELRNEYIESVKAHELLHAEAAKNKETIEQLKAYNEDGWKALKYETKQFTQKSAECEVLKKNVGALKRDVKQWQELVKNNPALLEQNKQIAELNARIKAIYMEQEAKLKAEAVEYENKICQLQNKKLCTGTEIDLLYKVRKYIQAKVKHTGKSEIIMNDYVRALEKSAGKFGKTTKFTKNMIGRITNIKILTKLKNSGIQMTGVEYEIRWLKKWVSDTTVTELTDEDKQLKDVTSNIYKIKLTDSKWKKLEVLTREQAERLGLRLFGPQTDSPNNTDKEKELDSTGILES